MSQPRKGDYLETVANGYTGVLVSPDVGSAVSAIRDVSKNSSAYTDECLKLAKKFDYPVFEKRITRYVADGPGHQVPI